LKIPEAKGTEISEACARIPRPLTGRGGSGSMSAGNIVGETLCPMWQGALRDQSERQPQF